MNARHHRNHQHQHHRQPNAILNVHSHQVGAPHVPSLCAVAAMNARHHRNHQHQHHRHPNAILNVHSHQVGAPHVPSLCAVAATMPGTTGTTNISTTGTQ